jgi:hypothetical protein
MTTRRRVLGLSGTIGAALLAGCTGSSGVNPRIRLESGLDEPVTIRVVVRRIAMNELTNDEAYAVEARSVRWVRVLGNDRYRVTASTSFDTVTFESEPTCSSARTAVFVTPDRELNASVQDCPE